MAFASLAQTMPLQVQAKCNIYYAGMPQLPEEADGVLPATLLLQPGTRFVLLDTAYGKVSCESAFYGPDGGQCVNTVTNIEGINGLSGIYYNGRTLFVVGVFLGPEVPEGDAPDRLDCSSWDAQPVLKPGLRQVFFIGDGRVGTVPQPLQPGQQALPQQRIEVPAGAARLFLGFADAFDFQGNPGTYYDNDGEVSVRLRQLPN
jgi:hypothetical protein